MIIGFNLDSETSQQQKVKVCVCEPALDSDDLQPGGYWMTRLMQTKAMISELYLAPCVLSFLSLVYRHTFSMLCQCYIVHIYPEITTLFAY